MKTIRLELARTKDEPQGNPGHAYEFRAPLNAAGELDLKEWAAAKELCTVHRFDKGAKVESGVLQHHRGDRWVFSFEVGTEDDEPIFKFSRHAFKEGEYISITEHDGVLRTFRVASVKDWHPDR